MRWRVELEGLHGFVYCSTARSFSSAWRTVERQISRDPQCRLRILTSRDDGAIVDPASWSVSARVESGKIVEWHGQEVAEGRMPVR